MSETSSAAKKIFPVVLSVGLIVASGSWAGPEPTAGQILKATGIKGGVVVHIGCGDGRVVGEFARQEGLLVHGLETEAADVEKARAYLSAAGIYGRACVDRFDGRHLPYVDNLVNLVVCEELGELSMDEVMRVLAPNGIAYVKKAGRWEKVVKRWPERIDQWTHYLHDPTNNAVSGDTVVGPPRHIQWAAGPKFARAHEQLASISAAVCAAGRLFYIIDEGPRADIRLRPAWRLVARDAFNGVLLWKRRIDCWAEHLRRFRSGPPDLALRLVAVGPRVYYTDGIDGPVRVLDAATGRSLWVYKDTRNTRQILHLGDKLVLLIDTQRQTTSQVESEIRRGVRRAGGLRFIVAVDALRDKILWRKEFAALVHPTVAVEGERVFCQTTETLFCLGLDDGEVLWRAQIRPELKGHEFGWESPTLVVHDGVVYCADFRQLRAFAAEDGRELWTGVASAGYNSPPDIFVIGDLVWTTGSGGERIGLDRLTGLVARVLRPAKGYMHHRCYRDKATDRFMLLGTQGVQFVDVRSGELWRNYWIRGTCQYGILPANGLLYVPPDSCACNLTAKLNGFYALAAECEETFYVQPAARLEKGPAYGRSTSGAGGDGALAGGSWPTYRHDVMRSGVSEAALPGRLRRAWEVELPGRLSSVTAADGRVFVGSVETHRVYALDAVSGEELWRYTAGGRIDSPPTIYKGLVVFGSADGWVYCVAACDGRLVWRFLAAPCDRRLVAFGQLESVWPVPGSVLVKDGELIVSAGRSSYLDGGIYVYRLAVGTGRVLSKTVIYSPEDGKQPANAGKEMRGALCDILSCDGRDVYMRQVKLDLETGSETGLGVHLFSPIGFLDDSWWHRAYWVLHDRFYSHWSGWWKVGNVVPSGRILCYDERSVFGYGRDRYAKGNTGQWRGGEKYRLFAVDRGPGGGARWASGRGGQGVGNAKRRAPGPASAVDYRWSRQVPMLVTAMLVAGETVFIAGPPDLSGAKGSSGEQALILEDPDAALAAWAGEKGALLWGVSARDGRKLSEYRLDSPPIFDGMAAADNRLYIALKGGRLVCLGAFGKGGQ